MNSGKQANLQQTDQENARQTGLGTPVHLQAPDGRQRQCQNHNVSDNVEGANGNEGCLLAAAHGVRSRHGIVGSPKGTADQENLENVACAPEQDEGHGNLGSSAQALIDEYAQVEKHDRQLDGADACGKDEFIRDQQLEDSDQVHVGL